MASKLFIFAIGGTGSRVVKALTMLLASGVELKNTSVIVPIIVDPHKANEDLKRTENLLKTYQRIRNVSKPKAGEFFSTEIKTLSNIISNADRIEDAYTFELTGVSNQKFGDYIDHGNLDAANKALADLLFSASNRDTDMDIGFVGNPNIGSVVLNQFKESEAFRQFAANFNPNDRIFIISSIFGGTGAAGFPIILKNIRGAAEEHPDTRVENPEHLKKARIGALTALPYFGLEPSDDKRVDQGTFHSKAKAALHYYARGVGKSVNKLYYIGDQLTKNYKYDPGDGVKAQQNDAHLIELASALAIVDFANLSDNELVTDDMGKPVGPVYAEFGLHNDVETVTFNDLGQGTLATIARPLSRMALFSMYLTNNLRRAAGVATWTKDAPVIDSSFMTGQFVRVNLNDFNTAFRDWLREMATNRRSFKPFGTDSSNGLISDPAQALAGYKPKSGFLGIGGKTDFLTMDEELNAYTKKDKQIGSAEEKLLRSMTRGLDKFLSNRFPDLFNSLPTTFKD